ncbi:hypothetical protein FZEAL_1351 [Fusarium zealandicum]|uniref:Sugar phosphate transporter domain-containing protein n=1 Tax=Fusarium zealandicum TaxID=1053134 RepID=A0A8H4XQ09_9HYPO|nr:hypothetical protein FZEAL_1351 [Fusarium zealandicum]
MAVSGDLEAGRELRTSQGSGVNSTGEKGKGPRLHASVYILSWIFFSNLTIIFNKWLIGTAGFRYPIILTTWHLIFATVATQILARTTSLLDSRHSLPLTRRLYVRTILPIGILYSSSLVFSNIVYLYLSVSFIQMLKSTGPVCVLITSWIWGVAQPDRRTLANIMLIVIGVLLASFGEIEFSWVGTIFQLCGTISEAVRLVMTQVMLSSEGLRMDPLVGLYYYAPVCAVMNMIVVVFSEGPSFKWEDVAKTGYGVLFANAFLAFILNIVSVFLIGKTSGLVMALSGILKSILLVAASVLIWQTSIGLLQVLGYSVALLGLVLYSVGYEKILEAFRDAGTWISGAWDSQGDTKTSPILRKCIYIGLLGFLTIVMAGSLWHFHGGSAADVMKSTSSWFGST